MFQTKFSQGSLKIIRYLGHSHRFIAEKGRRAHFRSRTSMIHIIPDAIGTAPQRTHHQRLCGLSRDNRAAGKNHLNADSHFCTERRILLGVITHRCIIGILLNILEHAKRRHTRFGPERIRIGSRHRNGFLSDYSCIAPSGSRVQRCLDSGFFGHLFQRFHVQVTQIGRRDFLVLYTHSYHRNIGIISGRRHVLRFARIRNSPRSRRMLVFIFYLRADNRSTVFIIQSFQLSANLFIKAFHILQVVRIVRTNFQGLGKQPVGKSSVSYFPMTERANSYHRPHIMFLTQ